VDVVRHQSVGQDADASLIEDIADQVKVEVSVSDHTDELMATGRCPDRYEAMKEAQRRDPHLDSTPPGITSMTASARPVSTGNAETELDRLARQMQSAERITCADAYRRLLIANPRLDTAHLEQRPRQTGGRTPG
jgi:hypothetical protein